MHWSHCPPQLADLEHDLGEKRRGCRALDLLSCQCLLTTRLTLHLPLVGFVMLCRLIANATHIGRMSNKTGLQRTLSSPRLPSSPRGFCSTPREFAQRFFVDEKVCHLSFCSHAANTSQQQRFTTILSCLHFDSHFSSLLAS